MALGLLGALDLSVVTDTLIKILENCRDTSPLWNPNNLAVNPGPSYTIHISGQAPETVRDSGDCELCLYLFHVAQDKFQKNAPVTGPRVPPIPYQPLSLDLYYLLTAFAKGDYVHEQQAMSIALRCFYENPIVRANVTIGTQTVKEEFCLTMEVETSDELGRLWQAITAPLRLAAVYKVSVVFMPPEVPDVLVAPKVTQVKLSADPTTLPYAESGQVVGTFTTVNYVGPNGSADQHSYNLSPATVAPGQTFLLYGAGLNPPAPGQLNVYLTPPGGAEEDVSAWISPDATLHTDTRLSLIVPAVGAPPAGIYQLRIGIGSYRSNATPVSLAASISGLADPPILTGLGTHTITGIGFISGSTEVLLDTITLAATGGAPGAGQFNVNGSGTAIAFQAPSNLAPGRYSVRIRVNQVESAPAWWIQV